MFAYKVIALLLCQDIKPLTINTSERAWTLQRSYKQGNRVGELGCHPAQTVQQTHHRQARKSMSGCRQDATLDRDWIPIPSSWKVHDMG